MKKTAHDDEILTRAHRMVLSRDQAKAEIDNLFTRAKPERKRDVAEMENLLIQAPGAQVQTPNLQKEALARNVSEFFEKKAYLTEAQRRYPELLKAAGTETQRQLLPSKPSPTKIPSKSVISGG